MAEFITCSECSNCFISYGIGFSGVVTYHCSERELKPVMPSDGCTFGMQGEHGTIKADVDIDIGAYAAVGGWDE